MRLRRFTPEGTRRFAEYRRRLAVEPALEPPTHLLEDDSVTELMPGGAVVKPREFRNRLEAGVYLNELLGGVPINLPEHDQGLWTWLTLFYFDNVCPPDAHGKRKAREEARLVALVDNYQRFYRHLLLGPFLIVRAHKDAPGRAMAFLCQPLWKPGDIVGQLASRKELVTNKAVAEAATRLYYDAASGSLKRGSGSKVKGGPRRLADLLNQLDVTWYLYGMTTEELLALLPKEFDRFR